MRIKLLDIILICFFIFLIIGFVFYLNFYKSEGNKCMSDPLGYAQDLTKSYCGCYTFSGDINAGYMCASRCDFRSLLEG